MLPPCIVSPVSHMASTSLERFLPLLRLSSALPDPTLVPVPVILVPVPVILVPVPISATALVSVPASATASLFLCRFSEVFSTSLTQRDHKPTAYTAPFVYCAVPTLYPQGLGGAAPVPRDGQHCPEGKPYTV